MKCFKCDRCGNYFYQTTNDNIVMIGSEIIESGEIETGREYHLCPDCMKSFEEWVSFPNDSREDLDWIWEYIDNYLSKNSHLRIAQFLYNLFNFVKQQTQSDGYYVEDEKLRELIVEYCRSHNNVRSK